MWKWEQQCSASDICWHIWNYFFGCLMFFCILCLSHVLGEFPRRLVKVEESFSKRRTLICKLKSRIIFFWGKRQGTWVDSDTCCNPLFICFCYMMSAMCNAIVTVQVLWRWLSGNLKKLRRQTSNSTSYLQVFYGKIQTVLDLSFSWQCPFGNSLNWSGGRWDVLRSLLACIW